MMKFCTRTIVVFFICIVNSSFVEMEQNHLKTGFYYLSDTEKEGILIKDVDGEDVYAVTKTEVLTSDDFIDARRVQRNFQPNPMQVIEVKLSKAGRKKWASIVSKIATSVESIVFVCNNNVYIEKSILGKGMIVGSTIDLLVELKHQDFIFQVITSEIKQFR